MDYSKKKRRWGIDFWEKYEILFARFRERIMKMKTKIMSAKKAAARKTTEKKTVAKKTAVKNVTFTLHADKGKAVYLAGEFNKWNPTAKKMTYKAVSGLYATTVKLAAGTYQYKFVMDGAWCADPANANAVANDQGTFNSVIVVK